MKPLKKHQSGFALIVILAAVVLCTLMVIIMTDRSRISVKSATAYSEGLQVRTLSDMVENIVRSQIQEATSLNQTIGIEPGERDTWASQPGALRVYQPNGTLREIYKLYSAADLTTTDPDLAKDVDPDWYHKPTEFTDLNEPVSDGTLLHYPVLNPDIANNAGIWGSDGAPSGISKGFSIENAPTQSGGNEAPMPTRWIYVLRDGTLCRLGDSRINRQTNPIIGRVAFWTDDETAKVNINTAAPVTNNSFWDVPRANSSKERDLLGWMQPAQNEYQRYPGHPAMVSLRSVLGNLSGLSSENYFRLTPRYYWGGSEDGTIRIKSARQSLRMLKQDRTYTSLDEILFSSQPEGGTTLRSQPTPETVDNLRFFLSASSRAPELNLFGQPRVTIWPIFGNPDNGDPGLTRRTPYDSLIAFNSTIGGKAYYFGREEPLDPTHDYAGIARNQALYSYLQKLTGSSIPGVQGTGSFSSKYGADRDQILTEIFDYIRITNLNEIYQEVAGDKLPNFESYTPNFLAYNTAKGEDVEDQINTTASYPRDGKARGAGLVVPIEIGDTRGMGRFPVITEAGLLFIVRSQKPEEDKTGDPHPTNPPAPSPENPQYLECLLTLETVTPAFGFMPWIGKDIRFEVVSSDLEFGEIGVDASVEPPQSVHIAGINAFSPGTGEAVYYPPLLASGFSPGGYDGAATLYGSDSEHFTGNAAAYSGPEQNQFFSAPLELQMEKIPPANPGDDPTYKLANHSFYVKGGTITVRILIGSTEIQQYQFKFDSIPELEFPFASKWGKNTNAPGKPWWRKRFYSNAWRGPLSTDILHSIELVHGDARLIAGQKIVDSSNFKEHKDYYNNQLFAHGMRESSASSNMARLWQGATLGTYVDLPTSSATSTATVDGYNNTLLVSKPKITSRITSLRGEGWSGDFDNGIGNYADGPFINKPDEGMSSPGTATYGTSGAPYFQWQWSVPNGLFSPLRQVPSAVMFGSLPTGVKANIPWRTLVFSPNPSDPHHIGLSAPADRYLLDLFRMPVVEPYAISGPLSTDGKINMNYAIAPFSYIRRASAWYALLEPMKIFTVPDSESEKYKGSPVSTSNFRHALNIEETLRQFEDRFATQDIFHTATDICSLFLVPEDSSGLSDVTNLNTGYWSKHRLTGDNSREKPYAELYSKLTTQSNTYRIHMRVQMLPLSDKAPAGQSDFTPIAEYRGSRLIERYIDADDNRLTTQANPDTDNLNTLYRFRVLETRQFNP